MNKSKASSNFTIMNVASIPLMRKLLTLNYSLSYSKFALRGITFCMKFSSHAMDASPHTLYAGLSELAKKSIAQVIYSDALNYLTFLRLPDGYNAPKPVAISNELAQAGEMIIAISHPLGLRSNTTQGIVS